MGGVGAGVTRMLSLMVLVLFRWTGTRPLPPCMEGPSVTAEEASPDARHS